MSKILVTGVAGFIGYFTAKKLLDDGYTVVGLDNLNSYYSPKLKTDRVANIANHPNFTFIEMDIENKGAIDELFSKNSFKRVIHLAAQAGVRYSLENPYAYINSNVLGFTNILEACRTAKTEHLVYASSSSVYGGNTKQPFSTQDNVDHPVSLYAATKKANELMAHTYSHLYGIPTTGLRFFTVYGEWGRPDMAPFIFADKILKNEPIDVFNHGNMERDFTYVADICEGVCRIADIVPTKISENETENPANSKIAPYKVYNIGNSSPVKLLDFIEVMENALGKKAIKNLLPMQKGDVVKTFADVEDLETAIRFKPQTTLECGIERFSKWFKEYYYG